MGKIKKEIQELLPIMVYFFFAFFLLGMTKYMILEKEGMVLAILARAAIGAFLMAKVILILGLLKFLEPFAKTPILYNALWKTALSMVFAILIQGLEEIIPLMFRGEGFAPMISKFSSVHFWLIQMWLVILFLVLWLFKDLIRAIGRESANQILLGIPEKNAGLEKSDEGCRDLFGRS